MLKRTIVKSRGKSTVRTSDWKPSLRQGGNLGNSSAGQNLSWCWPTPHLVCLPHNCCSFDCCRLCWEILQCAQFTDENDKLDGDITNLICIWISYMRGKNKSIYPMSVLTCHQYPTSGLAVGWWVLWENPVLPFWLLSCTPEWSAAQWVLLSSPMLFSLQAGGQFWLPWQELDLIALVFLSLSHIPCCWQSSSQH